VTPKTPSKRKAPVASQNVSRVSETVRVGICSRCGAGIGFAVCEALICRVDPIPLSLTEQAWSMARGRWLFELRGHGRTKWLRLHFPTSIIRNLFHSDYPVLGEHECGGDK
jgi:hypothetical protein